MIAVPAAVPDAVLAAIRTGQDSGELNALIDPVTAGQILTAVYFDTLTRWLLDDDPAPLAAQLADRVTAALDGLAAGIAPVS